MEINNEENLFITAKDQLPVKCYFCGEIFSEKQLQNHISDCRLVNENCSQNCGDTRQQKEIYISKQCSDNDKQKSQLKEHCVNSNCVCCEFCCKTIAELESELKILQIRIDDEKRNRLQFEYTWLTELSRFHDRYQKTEEWRVNMFSVLSTLQKSIFREEQIRLKEINDMKYRFDEITLMLQKFEIYVDEINRLINETKSYCSTKNDELCELFDDFRIQQQNRIASLHQLTMEFERLQIDHVNRSRSMLNLLDLNEIIIENQEECSKQVKDCNKDLNKFKKMIKEDNYSNSMWSEQLDQLKHFKNNFKKTEDKLRELLSWQKFAKKKLVKLENYLKFQPNELVIKEFQNSFVCYNDTPVYSNGHLLWCVLDFEEQFEESKLTTVVINSPVFYTNEYGYKLQMRLYPNGLGQWKGRHMIISLHILESDWDSLLEWPIKINATVLMRDQLHSNDEVKDLIKCFGNNIIHRENDSTKLLQMFVPHRTLRENNYINQNSLILEAIVKIKNE